MILMLSVSALLVCSSALPRGIGPETLVDTITAGTAAIRENSADTQNVVVVPPNCPVGQTLVNGVCREIWRMKIDGADTQNVVIVPPNCPPGQTLVNGVCRDIWKTPIVKLECPIGYTLVGGECIDWFRNVVTVPNNCPEGQVWVNGACREVWPTQVFPTVAFECPFGYKLIAGQCIDWLRNVVTVPSNCPEAQVWLNGACRDVWRALHLDVKGKTIVEPVDHKNTVIVPENCKPNQQFINGQCRDIWRN
ncbi:uncharacterized protein LOC128683925 [Plodia interpunctella]|uniref:uncharacterized protein LOC128683925 n=1 Tax=Plodia interpunctella TaxID=58824 RepID=UPI002368C16F|nr:uncharacterized protein LOC128683925 [Plodia interpunctella]